MEIQLNNNKTVKTGGGVVLSMKRVRFIEA
jgi:hypothetical protein